jgi:hypothetical protein
MPEESRWRGADNYEQIDPGQQLAAVLVFEREVAEATRRRQHYWFAVVGYKVIPPLTGTTILDHESMRFPPNVGCYICETRWSDNVPPICPGEPR